MLLLACPGRVVGQDEVEEVLVGDHALVGVASEVGLDAGLAAELDASERIFASDDLLEGAAAFFAKRDPVYRGR